jgi:hypothetical protein
VFYALRILKKEKKEGKKEKSKLFRRSSSKVTIENILELM